MRYTPEPDMDVRTVPAGQVWAGIIGAEKPYIAIASQLDDGDTVIVARLGAVDARDMGRELIRLSLELTAPSN
ncbi:MAG: hypothetical protein H0W90_08265 [Actinobacteria bacterium]|nr:hypothetical protein [Actinomycetota bacterium]